MSKKQNPPKHGYLERLMLEVAKRPPAIKRRTLEDLTNKPTISGPPGRWHLEMPLSRLLDRTMLGKYKLLSDKKSKK